jgi:uncharacterized membrane protein
MPKKMPALHRGVALTRSERKKVGPIQIVVVGFENLTFEDELVPELRRLNGLDVIRLVDMVVVTKSESGELVRVPTGSLTDKEAERLGSIAELLVGLTDAQPATDDAGAESTDLQAFLGDDGTWSVVDVIPTGEMCVVALIEHRWAIPLRESIHKTGGRTLADAWIHPDDPVLDQLGERRERRG